MGLFSREAPCDGCLIPFEKNALYGFDPTWRRNRRSDDKRRRLCAACVSSALEDYLIRFAHRALAVEPARDGNAYLFAPLDRASPRLWTWTDELQEQVRDLLPKPEAACARCRAPAQYTWCGPEIFRGVFAEYVLAERGSFPEEPRCGKCVAAAVDQAFRELGTVFHEVSPPADTDGALFPASI